LIDRSGCNTCGKCVDVCPRSALEIKGEKKTVNEIMDVVLKDERYYARSGGGLTLSGGEPMAQYEFSLELLRLAKEHNIHTCLETSGHADKSKILSIMPYVDIFLYDFKAGNDDDHVSFTGVSQKLILDNLYSIDNAGAKTILRCPIIPAHNDNEQHFNAIAKTVSALHNIIEINVMPYHPMGSSKAKRIGGCGGLDLGFPTDEQIDSWLGAIKKEVSVAVKRS